MSRTAGKLSGLLAIAVCASLSVSAAMADPGQGHGHGHKNKGHGAAAASDKADDGKVSISIGGGDRDVIRNYIRRDSEAHCPPGLAKKHNGCLPPGIAKKYAVGQRLPDDVAIMPVPDDLLALLQPAPRGYMYARVDKDVLLVSEATKKVVDAVTLLSAVGK
jgi:Ni/Co efflux regulator RcnB